MNLAKQKNASSSEGSVYRNGAARTFIPCTYVKLSGAGPREGVGVRADAKSKDS